jgi:hypothetical protein
MRLIFIHGFGEKPCIFDNIHQAFNHEKLFIHNWEELGNELKQNYTVLDYAKDLVVKYKISQSDIVIGHSLGGWISAHVKYISNCKSIQIASWTDMNCVKFPINNYSLIRLFVKLGLTFNRFSRNYFLKKSYQGLPSESIFIENYNYLIRGNKSNILNQLNLILLGSNVIDSLNPDLRIHSKADRLIRFPKHPCEVVNGDHFNLWTYPDEVINAIRKII